MGLTSYAHIYKQFANIMEAEDWLQAQCVHTSWDSSCTRYNFHGLVTISWKTCWVFESQNVYPKRYMFSVFYPSTQLTLWRRLTLKYLVNIWLMDDYLHLISWLWNALSSNSLEESTDSSWHTFSRSILSFIPHELCPAFIVRLVTIADLEAEAV